MEKKTKLVILGGVVALNVSGAIAADFEIGAKDADRSKKFEASATGFVVNEFTFTASKNVGLMANEGKTAISVQAANIKGSRIFGGSSNGGGGIKACKDESVANPEPKKPATENDGCA